MIALHPRACAALFGCAVCPRPMVALFAVRDGGFLALCAGYARGFLRFDEERRSPREVLTAPEPA